MVVLNPRITEKSYISTSTLILPRAEASCLSVVSNKVNTSFIQLNTMCRYAGVSGTGLHQRRAQGLGVEHFVLVVKLRLRS